MIDTVVQDTWNRILDRLRAEIGDRTWSMWFDRSRVVALKRGVLAVGVPNLFIRDWIEEHYGDLLGRLAGEELGASVRVAVKVDADLFREMRHRTERIEESVDAGPDVAQRKTLENFLVTAGHDLAVKALRHVASGEAPPMNPLVVYGPEGTGKSHLAEAVLALFPPGSRSYRVTGEEFARRFAWNLKTRRTEEVRNDLASARVVVLDDAHGLAGKVATEREASLLAQALRARGGQLIVFLDRHPKDVPEFGAEFESVLLSGMIVGIEPPDAEAAVAILERVLVGARRRIPRSVIEMVVREAGGSVKRLDRLVRKIYAFAGLTGEPVDEEFVRRHLAEIAGPKDPVERRLETIFQVVLDHFGVEREDLVSKRKTKSLARPRGLVVYLLREHAGLTFKDIGKRLGSRSHTSVFLLHQKYSELVGRDAELGALVREAARRLVTAGG